MEVQGGWSYYMGLMRLCAIQALMQLLVKTYLSSSARYMACVFVYGPKEFYLESDDRCDETRIMDDSCAQHLHYRDLHQSTNPTWHIA